ncbi:MAG: acyltransferase [Gemmataceae bacterium]|nr:acyltransferase [Gemmataceae bacterium]
MPPPDRRLFSLDALRGLAVLMVLAAHVPLPDGFAHGPGGRVFRLGIYGVVLFFVLSGFLISRLLYGELGRTGRVDVRRFWLRRGLKIWPAYYAAYGAAFGLALALAVRAGEPVGPKFVEAVPNLLFVQTYVWPETRWDMSWSLAVEEHFYLALPLVLVAVGVRRLPWVCLAGCLAGPVLRALAADPELARIQTHTRADALCLGVLLGYAHHYHRGRFFPRVRRWRVPLLVLGPAALAVPFVWGYSESLVMRAGGLTLLALASAGVVAVAAAYPDAGRFARGPVGWAARGLGWVGVYSYTIYLAQAVTLPLVWAGGDVLNRLFARLSGLALDVRGVAFVLLTLAWGVALSRLVERPFLRLREKWVPSDRKRDERVVIEARIPAPDRTTTPVADRTGTLALVTKD